MPNNNGVFGLVSKSGEEKFKIYIENYDMIFLVVLKWNKGKISY